MVYYPHTPKEPNTRVTVLSENFTKHGPKESKSLETDMRRLVTVISLVEWRQGCSEFNQPLLKLTLAQAWPVRSKGCQPWHIISWWEPVTMAIIKKKKKSINIKCQWGCGEKGTIVHYWRDCNLVQTRWRRIEVSQKTKNWSTIWPSKSILLGLYLGKIKAIILKDVYSPKFIAALFTILEDMEEPMCPSTDKWLRKMSYIYKYRHNNIIQQNTIQP